MNLTKNNSSTGNKANNSSLIKKAKEGNKLYNNKEYNRAYNIFQECMKEEEFEKNKNNKIDLNILFICFSIAALESKNSNYKSSILSYNNLIFLINSNLETLNNKINPESNINNSLLNFLSNKAANFAYFTKL